MGRAGGTRKLAHHSTTSASLVQCSGLVRSACAHLTAGAAFFVLRRPVPLVMLCVAALALMRNGTSYFYYLAYELSIVDQLPGRIILDSRAAYLVHSPIGPWLARALGIRTGSEFVMLHVFVLALGLASLLFVVWRRRGPRAARILAVALAGSPALTHVLHQLGSYDVFTLIFGSALVMATDLPGLLVASLALGLGHFEQGVFVLASIAILGSCRVLNSKRGLLAAAGGLVVGKIALIAYLAAIVTPGSRMDAFSGSLHDIVNVVASYPAGVVLVGLAGLVYSLFGSAWAWMLPVMGSSYPGVETKRLLAALAVILVPSLLTSDPSRVFAMVSWPVLMSVVLMVERRADDAVFRRLAATLLLALILLPSVEVFYWRASVPLLESFTWLRAIAGVLVPLGLLFWEGSIVSPAERTC